MDQPFITKNNPTSKKKYLKPKQLFFRDIKPGNMLLFNNGVTLKITDMGLAREVSEESMTGTAGTLKYMSPGNYLLSRMRLAEQKLFTVIEI